MNVKVAQLLQNEIITRMCEVYSKLFCGELTNLVSELTKHSLHVLHEF